MSLVETFSDVDDTDGQQAHQRVDKLVWSETEMEHGKLIHIKGFPKGHRVKVFRLVLSSKRTDYVVTNDINQDSAQAAKDNRGLCWKIEQFHREAKQVTGVEKCQCRKQRAHQTGKTIYQLKFGLLSDYMCEQLKRPSIRMALA